MTDGNVFYIINGILLRGGMPDVHEIMALEDRHYHHPGRKLIIKSALGSKGSALSTSPAKVRGLKSSTCNVWCTYPCVAPEGFKLKITIIKRVAHGEAPENKLNQL